MNHVHEFLENLPCTIYGGTGHQQSESAESLIIARKRPITGHASVKIRNFTVIHKLIRKLDKSSGKQDSMSSYQHHLSVVVIIAFNTQSEK